MRQALRLILLSIAFLLGGVDHLVRFGRKWDMARRARWMRRCAIMMTRVMGFRIRVVGTPPSGGFIVPNHLGYMDILVLGSIVPQAFLSRGDVKDWPVIGAYTRMAGTLYIDRKRKSDVANKEEAFASVIDAGIGMTFFLEGTSSDGEEVLPFRASLLEPVVKRGWPITPAYLKYECEGGNPKTDVCWWGDMTFGAHLLKMAALKSVTATVVFGETIKGEGDRKVLALELREKVLELREIANKANSPGKLPLEPRES